METDLYAGFAGRYDLFPVDGMNPFQTTFEKLFRGGDVRKVLDCACGTGREIILLRRLGFDVTGSDISSSMLDECRKNLSSLGIDSTLVQADYRELTHFFETQFDAVVCLRSSIAHMPDDAQALRAFKSMFSVLRTRGLLVLSQATTDAQWNEKPRFILQADTREMSRLIVVDYLGERDAIYSVVDIFHGKGGRDLRVWSARYHFLFCDEQEKQLRDAGFREITFYGSYGLDPYDREASQNLITVALK